MVILLNIPHAILALHTHTRACTHNMFSFLSKKKKGTLCYQVKHYFQTLGDVDITMLHLILFPHFSK